MLRNILILGAEQRPNPTGPEVAGGLRITRRQTVDAWRAAAIPRRHAPGRSRAPPYALAACAARRLAGCFVALPAAQRPAPMPDLEPSP